jgi:hypothetical protein
MGGGLLSLLALGARAPTSLLQDVIVDGATAFVVLLAMAFGLIIPSYASIAFARPSICGGQSARHDISNTAAANKSETIAKLCSLFRCLSVTWFIPARA